MTLISKKLVVKVAFEPMLPRASVQSLLKTVQVQNATKLAFEILERIDLKVKFFRVWII